MIPAMKRVLIDAGCRLQNIALPLKQINRKTAPRKRYRGGRSINTGANHGYVLYTSACRHTRIPYTISSCPSRVRTANINDRKKFLHHSVRRQFQYAHLPLIGDLVPEARVGKQKPHRILKFPHVVVGDQQTSFAIGDDLAVTSRRRSNDRGAKRHCLKKLMRKSFI